MNISYNWLKDLIAIDLPPEELALKLTRVGLAVEGIRTHGDDQVFDIDLTSNRPDCLSHLGIAREIGVITNSPLRFDGKETFSTPADADLVTITEDDLCHRFTARVIRNVKIGPSPKWIVQRLDAIGERSINNIADITNYVMHELGQPMHAFDLDKLTGRRIVVRTALHGETIKTLDETDRKLDETMMVICDAEKPAAVAGIMGGSESAISESTVNVLLEVAYFKRENIRRTSRILNLVTEASYRFERGVDIENLTRASDRATELIVALASGEPAEFLDVYPKRYSPYEIHSSDISASVSRLTGLAVETNDCVRILNSLGITSDDAVQSTTGSSQLFHSPSWRHDISNEEDLVEEIARHSGYENIAVELPPLYGAGEYQPNEMRKLQLRRTLIEMGFDEAISYSFIDRDSDEIFEHVPSLFENADSERFVTLQHSVIDGAVRMRPTLLPGLLDALRTNFNHQRRNVSLFEVGKAFASNAREDRLPYERELFALVMTGSEVLENRAMPGRDFDFYDAKGAVEASLNAAGISDLEFADADVRHLRKGQSSSISLNGRIFGYVGRLRDDISAAYKFRQPVFVAEVELQSLLAVNTLPIVYRPLPRYPAIIRDVSLLAERSTSYDAIRDAVIDRGSELCRSVAFVDTYEGKGIGDNERSITVRLEYRSDERTLIDEEVDALHKEIVSGLEDALGAIQRT
ncbi:MAG: phenylalanine--tRNA ligase subunit beta [Pyrinomonadaceae bacterium]